MSALQGDRGRGVLVYHEHSVPGGYGATSAQSGDDEPIAPQQHAAHLILARQRAECALSAQILAPHIDVPACTAKHCPDASVSECRVRTAPHHPRAPRCPPASRAWDWPAAWCPACRGSPPPSFHRPEDARMQPSARGSAAGAAAEPRAAARAALGRWGHLASWSFEGPVRSPWQGHALHAALDVPRSWQRCGQPQPGLRLLAGRAAGAGVDQCEQHD